MRQFFRRFWPLLISSAWFACGYPIDFQGQPNGIVSTVDAGMATPVDASVPDAGDAGTTVDAGPNFGDAGLVRVEIDVTDGGVFEFTVPPGAIGVHAAAFSSIDGFPLTFTRFEDSTGHNYIQNNVPEGTDVDSSQGANLAALTLPMTSVMQMRSIAPGRYTAQVTGQSPSSTVHVVVAIQHTRDGEFHGGALNLDLFIPDGLLVDQPDVRHAISAADAGTDPCVTQRVDAFFEAAHSLAGFDRGEVRFHSMPAAFLSVDTDQQMISAGAATTVLSDAQPSIRIVWTNLLSSFGQEIWGQSGGIPGAAAIRGLHGSVVFMEVAPVFPPRGDGFTMLHEMGHFSGLRHTTELDASQVDWVSDTPECTTITPTMYMQCPDHTNVMFPVYWGATNGGMNVSMSDAQRKVLHAVPTYTVY